MVVVLLGYMGSGKSVIGRRLSEVLNYDFIDLDDYISNSENNSITALFREKGEIFFRRKETEYLQEIIASKDKVVLALGGGTPCYSNNMERLISKDGIRSFYLKLSITELTNRLYQAKSKRPLIAHIKARDELTEFIGKHLFERVGYYSEAEFTIDCNNKSIQDVTEEIISCLL